MKPELFKAGEMPRAQLRMPQEAYIQIDQWTDYLGYEQYVWHKKFISWVDRSPSRTYEFHIPYTLESVYEKLGVSKSHFYKKIRILWECGLIDLVEFDKSTRKTTKPRNIIVYNYPFNKSEFEYLPLEKRRDWITQYESESKAHGFRGALKAREIRGLQMETVEKTPDSPVDNSPVSVDNPVDNSPVDNVDNLENKGLQMETVEGLQMETVTVSNERPINCTNNLLILNNNSIHSLNNSLSQTKIDLIQKELIKFDFKEGERERIIELINIKNLSITLQDITQQAKFMSTRPNIRNRSSYFVTGLEMNEGRTYPTKAKTNQDQEAVTTPLPFYNWLES
jgi:hypothetical protein